MLKRHMLYALTAIGVLLGGVVVASAATNLTKSTPASIAGPTETAESRDAAEPAETGDGPGGADTGPNVDHQFDGEENHAD